MNKYIITLFLCLSPTLAKDGWVIGNGGDTIFCKKSDANDFQGHYTLDYLLEYKTDGNISNLITISSWEESKLRIQNLLQKLNPALSIQFKDFTKSIMKQSYNRRWKEENFGLIDIKDEEISRLLPKNCLRNDDADIRQTVIRKYHSQYIEYSFDREILSSQRVKNPLQYSFL